MKNQTRCFALAAVLTLSTAAAFGWGNATHMYIADRLGAKYPLQNTYELYGAVLPDIYAYSFDPFSVYVHGQLHNSGACIQAVAQTKELKSVAFGFLAHNHLFGADATAHISAITAPGEGYAVWKGKVIGEELVPSLVAIFTAAGIPGEELPYGLAMAVAPELGHDVAETAVDILIKRQDDKCIGAKVLVAATARPKNTATLLCKAFEQELAAQPILTLPEAKARLIADEAAFRTVVQQYGLLFCLPENTVIAQLAGMMAPLAENFIEASIAPALAGYGLPPADITITPAFVAESIRKAMLVVAPDYKAEVNATIAAVSQRLDAGGITNSDPRFVFWKEGGEVSADAANAGVPAEFALAGNYPNPFNPATTVRYDVAEARHIRLVVYDMMGREVEVLVDEAKEPGSYTAVWNARAYASGVYLCRMSAGAFVHTTRMVLQK